LRKRSSIFRPSRSSTAWLETTVTDSLEAARRIGVAVFYVPHRRWREGNYDGWRHPGPGLPQHRGQDRLCQTNAVAMAGRAVLRFLNHRRVALLFPGKSQIQVGILLAETRQILAAEKIMNAFFVAFANFYQMLRQVMRAGVTMLEINREVILGIRPEHIVPAQGPTGALPLAVDFVEALGADTLAHGSIGGSRLQMTVRLPGGARVAAGDVLSLTVPPDRLHLFDAGTGQRL
jgi:hypothetical protein